MSVRRKNLVIPLTAFRRKNLVISFTGFSRNGCRFAGGLSRSAFEPWIDSHVPAARLAGCRDYGWRPPVPPPRSGGSGFSIGRRVSRKAEGAAPDERQQLYGRPERVLSLLPACIRLIL